ncbi:MAG: hypothetical protein B7Y41_04665 [Hydrogenophilales bacterium 28-61-23]|nr:MAG: hypothetical protein B7Y41_04665 [Hydrogenophilales bacterium 28-61-23]
MDAVSVIIPTQNRPALLDEAIQSLMSQTLPPAEVIVVDDGSNPVVDPVALEAKFGPSVRVLRNEIPRGLAYSRNMGVEYANSEYVTHLDDDDLLAPSALREAYEVLKKNPNLDLVFFAAEGFGPNAEHFNRVQPEAVARVINLAGGREIDPGLFYFDRALIKALLQTVPIAFQRVMLRRETWHEVSALRRRAYCLELALPDDDVAKLRITGPLRDSEWAVYAGAVCKKAVLINRPLYLQRCAGQGYSSQPAMKDLHMRQNLSIKTQLLRASLALPELEAWRPEIRDSVAATHFDAAYASFHGGQRLLCWRHLWQAILLRPRLTYMRFALRTIFPRFGQAENPRA